MQLHQSDAAVADLERRSDGAPPAERARLLTELAWFLAQRDSRRALDVVEDARALLEEELDAGVRARSEARLSLVEAEAATLFGRLEDADSSLRRARLSLAAWAGSEDEESLERAAPIEIADAWRVEALIAKARGERDREMRAYAAAVQASQIGQDPERERLYHALEVFEEAFADPVAAHSHFTALNANLREEPSTALSALLFAIESNVISNREPERSAVLALNASEAARQVGMIRLAIVCALNAGTALYALGDYEGALDAMEWAAGRASETGWPQLVAGSKSLMGGLMLQLGHLDRSHTLLSEALAQIEHAPGSSIKGTTYQLLGHLYLKQGRYADATGALDVAATLLRRVQSTDNLVETLILQGQAAAGAGRFDAAQAALREAHSLIETFRFDRQAVDLHETWGELHRRSSFPSPSGMTAPTAAIHHLEAALAAGRKIPAWQPPANLLMALAQAWADAGDTARSFELAKEALGAAQRAGITEANRRATLALVRQEIDRANADARHHRELAQTLAETSRTLDRLGRMGQEITANLESERVFEAIYQNLGSLVDASHMGIWMVDPTGMALDMRYGRQQDHRFPPQRTALDDPQSQVALCARERREVVIDDAHIPRSLKRIPSPTDTRSALFGPLIVGQRLLGVLSIQSERPDAYGERDRLIFRSLCAYGAIALDNADAYRRLQDTRAQLQQALTELEAASLIDPLTGLKNRRFIIQHLESDMALAVREHEDVPRNGLPRENADVVLFLIDLDHFKQVNDFYGHAAGDAVLVQAGQRFREVLRESDHIVRWGGEEFLIAARSVDRRCAEELAERLRTMFVSRPFILEGGIELEATCSIGFASFPFVEREPRALTWLEVVDLADIGLYAAKHAGRNAWVGLVARDSTPVKGLVARARDGLSSMVDSRELNLLSNRPLDEVLEAVARVVQVDARGR